jgi:hypothetical protein
MTFVCAQNSVEREVRESPSLDNLSALAVNGGHLGWHFK